MNLDRYATLEPERLVRIENGYDGKTFTASDGAERLPHRRTKRGCARSQPPRASRC
jgi:hypothetical protein